MVTTSPTPLTPGLAVQQAISMKRSARHLSQRELSRRSGLSESYVSALESGQLHPTLRTFAKLAVELRLTPHEIYLVIAAEAAEPELT